jgi:hypothetical protein
MMIHNSNNPGAAQNLLGLAELVKALQNGDLEPRVREFAAAERAAHERLRQAEELERVAAAREAAAAAREEAASLAQLRAAERERQAALAEAGLATHLATLRQRELDAKHAWEEARRLQAQAIAETKAATEAKARAEAREQDLAERLARLREAIQ